MGKYKTCTSSIFFSKTVKAAHFKLGEEVHNNFKNLLIYNFFSRPHGGAITAHFTFCPVTLEP